MQRQLREGREATPAAVAVDDAAAVDDGGGADGGADGLVDVM